MKDKKIEIELTDKGLIELQKLVEKLDKTPFADTLRASEKLDRVMRDLEERREVEIILRKYPR